MRDTIRLWWIAGGLLLASCGGGGSGSPVSGGSGGGTSWVQGQFSPASTYAALCQAPRTGTDPSTQKPYPDKQGTA